MGMATDPVCGMQVDTETTPNKLEHDGTMYYFCSRGCMLDFQDEPQKFPDPNRQPMGMDAGDHHSA